MPVKPRLPDNALEILSTAGFPQGEPPNLFPFVAGLPKDLQTQQEDDVIRVLTWTFADGSIELEIRDFGGDWVDRTVTITKGNIGASWLSSEDSVGISPWKVVALWIGEDTEPTTAEWMLVSPAGLRMI